MLYITRYRDNLQYGIKCPGKFKYRCNTGIKVLNAVLFMCFYPMLLAQAPGLTIQLVVYVVFLASVFWGVQLLLLFELSIMFLFVLCRKTRNRSTTLLESLVSKYPSQHL